jgi:hypothetical protein
MVANKIQGSIVLIASMSGSIANRVRSCNPNYPNHADLKISILTQHNRA